MIDSKFTTLLTVIKTGSFTKAAEMLSLTQPAISHHIHSLESEYKIQMFYTKLKTIDNKLIIVPNGMLADNCIINYTSLGYRAIILKFPISYNESIARVKGVLNEYIDKLDYIERGEDKTPIIYVDELADNNIVIGMRVWVDADDYYKYKWRITEEVKTLFDKNNIVIPFNQLDVHIN